MFNQQLNHLRRHLLPKTGPLKTRSNPGQVVVIFVLSLTMLILFMGLALDAGTVYINYDHLKRAVDSAAISAANAFRGNSENEDFTHRLAKIQGAAVETIVLDGITVGSNNKGLGNVNEANVKVYTCSASDDGSRDTSLATTNPEFYAMCPDTSIDPSTHKMKQDPRKLVWVQATLKIPLYFLQLLGRYDVTLTTHSVSEASPIDLVIVMDTSGSMAHDTIKQVAAAYNAANPGKTYDENDFDPSSCISSDDCQPLKGAKDAAKQLIGTLYEGYDRVNIITFDLYARSVTGGFVDVTTAKTDIESKVILHTDPPFYRLWSDWSATPGNNPIPVFNPVNPEDFDGDGTDADRFDTAPGLNYGTFTTSTNSYTGVGCPTSNLVPAIPGFTSSTNPWSAYQVRWWDDGQNGDKNPGNINMIDNPGPPAAWAGKSNYGGAPCDHPLLFDSYDWNKTGLYAGTPDFDEVANDLSIRRWLTGTTLGTDGNYHTDATSANQLALKSFLCNPNRTDYLTSFCYTHTIVPNDLFPSNNPNGSAGLKEDPQDHGQQRDYHDVAGRLLSHVTTCTGCAMNQAYINFNNQGRDNATWVMVLLSDGVANVTDQPEQNDSFFYAYNADNTATTWDKWFPNGFCAGRSSGNKGLWLDQQATPFDSAHPNYLANYCVEPNPPSVAVPGSIRYCVNKDKTTCPPDGYGPTGSSVHVQYLQSTDPGSASDYLGNYINQIKYGPIQYAMDMTDRLALSKRKAGLNATDLGSNEPIKAFGDKSVAIYTIGFGKTDILNKINGQAVGENLLRYIASVGDDGDRQTDPCFNTATGTPIANWVSCGNYYYAPDANGLNRVFEDIAKRVQTKISN